MTTGLGVELVWPKPEDEVTIVWEPSWQRDQIHAKQLKLWAESCELITSHLRSMTAGRTNTPSDFYWRERFGERAT